MPNCVFCGQALSAGVVAHKECLKKYTLPAWIKAEYDYPSRTATFTVPPGVKTVVICKGGNRK